MVRPSIAGLRSDVEASAYSSLPEELQPNNMSGRPVPLGLVRRTRTDATGRYAFRVGPGTYWFGAVGGEPSAVHQPAPLTVNDEAEIRKDIARAMDGEPLGLTLAPVKANRKPAFDYALFPPRGNPMASCKACHRSR